MIHVLHVEDSPGDARLMREVLHDREEVTLHQTASGEEGLAYLREGHEVDVILLDFHLPGMDANDMLAALRDDKLLADIPTVVLTAKIETSPLVRRKPLGLDDFLALMESIFLWLSHTNGDDGAIPAPDPPN